MKLLTAKEIFNMTEQDMARSMLVRILSEKEEFIKRNGQEFFDGLVAELLLQARKNVGDVVKECSDIESLFRNDNAPPLVEFVEEAIATLKKAMVAGAIA